MSSMEKQTVTCPKCGKEIEFTMWRSFNNMMDNAMSDIISGKLFEIECKNCGLKTHINYPILVNDMEHNVMIYYVFPEETEGVEETFESQKKWYTGKLRIVTDMASLIEKVAIFNDGLDDRVIELLKEEYLSLVQDQLAGKAVESMYYHTGEKPCFEIVYDGRTGYIEISMDLYEEIKEAYFGTEELSKDDEVYVDRDWAGLFLSAGEEG